MKTDDLPLLELFNQLRQAGLPLGIGEYQLLLRSLEGGFGHGDRAALARLCKMLWVKSFEEERLFNYYFDLLVPRASTARRVVRTPFSRLWQRVTKIFHNLSITNADSEIAELFEKKNREKRVVKALLMSGRIDDDGLPGRFLHSDEYFPLTRRQMKQSWRYLRQPTREGPATELDIETTVKNASRLGMLLAPVFLPPRRNRVELLLLIDHGGSMVPFHLLAQRLAETALRGGKLGKTRIYYFHNYPEEYLYRDSTYLEAESLEHILLSLRGRRTKAIIFSDAGAARGGFSTERVEMTKAFLVSLKPYVHRVVWLNPMPRSRWIGTTAHAMMHLIPTFDVSRRGFDSAINILRGHPAPRV